MASQIQPPKFMLCLFQTISIYRSAVNLQVKLVLLNSSGFIPAPESAGESTIGWSTILVCLELPQLSEKAMAPHSSTLAWKIQQEEPGRLQSMGSQRVRHDWAISLSLFTFMHWRRKWQPTPVFLPGESQGQQSLVGCRLTGRTELDTTEAI